MIKYLQFSIPHLLLAIFDMLLIISNSIQMKTPKVFNLTDTINHAYKENVPVIRKIDRLNHQQYLRNSNFGFYISLYKM